MLFAGASPLRTLLRGEVKGLSGPDTVRREDISDFAVRPWRALMIQLAQIETPVGGFAYAHKDGIMLRTRFMREEPIEVFESMLNTTMVRSEFGQSRQIEDAVQAYFAGDDTKMATLTIRPAGSSFQLQAWTALRAVPFGHTVSYGELALAIGRRHSSRAMGAAMGANPIPLVVPCHRVIGRSGALVGFGAGIDLKIALLRHEGRLLSL